MARRKQPASKSKNSKKIKKPLPVLLIILDGWGYRKNKKGNAIAQASTPHIDSLMKRYPSTVLKASGTAVGLPAGAMGNSEVGHLTIGSGRIVDSYPVRINNTIKNKSFFRNTELIAAIAHAKRTGGTLHLMGLLSDKNVHSAYEHLFCLLKLCKQKKFDRVLVHGILDGRDTDPHCSLKYIAKTMQVMKHLGVGRFGTLIGRYYAMDRDNRWMRTKKAYDLLVLGKGKKVCPRFSCIQKAVKHYYSTGLTDEFIPPITLDMTPIAPKDSVIFFNFREDRARQITRSLIGKSFLHFKRKPLRNIYFCGFTRYDETLTHPVAFPFAHPKKTLGEIYANAKLSQLRVAETEKYAHVTYFFNGLNQRPFAKEHRVLIPSPKVSTYDKTPQMSAKKITDAALKGIKSGRHSLIVVNYANADMVGHTGNFAAAKKAATFTDHCVGKLTKAMLDSDGYAIITADHGNADNMLGASKTSHDTSPVPLILCHGSLKGKKIRKGGLCDVAPTILSLAGIPRNKAMAGKSLL